MDIIQQVDRWARVAPQAVAHVSGQRQLTYGELRERSDALAAHLAQRLKNDFSPIAVLGHREPEMLIAFLGVVKSGRPYLPLDPLLPRRRLHRILNTARVQLVLTPAETAAFSGSRAELPLKALRNDDPFYILFTSGSTGEPKGVIITAGCLHHFLTWMLMEQQFIESGEIFLNQAPFSFDLSVMDLYCSLATGGTLFSIGRDLVANPKQLYLALSNSGLTTWVSTPSFAQLCLAERKFGQDMLPRLRRFLFCGETLARETAERLRQRFPTAQIWNTYGPTEATVACTSVQITDAILENYSALPVGRPMPGTAIFVTGEGDHARPVPLGTPGEIIIAGPNVSPGYLARPDLTARAFSEDNGQRAYCTGDRGRFSDGLLFFEGRMDHQIKFNGYRIELGDIEGNLRAISGIHDAIVLPVTKQGRTTSLAAFVVSDNGAECESASKRVDDLRQALGERLPAYMIPRRFIFLEAFPMTPNGKADRSRLTALL
ncbi:MAG TPA: D-alanine--poly(phosphoribitol) ligase subunit DltA [Chthoniobacterales bacterium]